MKPLLLDTNIVDALWRRNYRHLLVDKLLNHGQPLASCLFLSGALASLIVKRKLGCSK